MNSAIAWFRKVQFRPVLTTLLAGLMFFGMVVGQWFYPLPAQAASMTPEAKEYQVDHGQSRIRINSEMAKDNVKEKQGDFADSLKGTAETVREKLNLDEPLPESTRDFFQQIRGEKVQVEEPRPSGK